MKKPVKKIKPQLGVIKKLKIPDGDPLGGNSQEDRYRRLLMEDARKVLCRFQRTLA